MQPPARHALVHHMHPPAHHALVSPVPLLVQQPFPLSPKVFRHFCFFLSHKPLKPCTTTFPLGPQGFPAFFCPFCQTSCITTLSPWSPGLFRHSQGLLCNAKTLIVFYAFYCLQPPGSVAKSKSLASQGLSAIFCISFCQITTNPIAKSKPPGAQRFPPFFEPFFAQ